MTELQKQYARTFNTNDGRAVLEHLRKITIERPIGVGVSDGELRWIAAQCALVHKIECLVQGGK